MSCDPFHELISADLDGEVGEAERARLADHLATCADCTVFAAAAARLHRATRVAPAAPVPDLTEVILERAAADPSIDLVPPAGSDARVRARSTAAASLPARRSRRVAVLAFQYGLLVVALAMMALAVPELFATSGDAVHTSRHLGGWDVAFAVGLVVAALQPWRARALIPMATALAGVMVITAGVDIAHGSTPSAAEGSHLLELFGLLFLWLLARTVPGRRQGGQPDRASWGDIVGTLRGTCLFDGPARFARSGAATDDGRFAPVAQDRSETTSRRAA